MKQVPLIVDGKLGVLTIDGASAEWLQDELGYKKLYYDSIVIPEHHVCLHCRSNNSTLWWLFGLYCTSKCAVCGARVAFFVVALLLLLCFFMMAVGV
jgi:hypothetical protein